MPKSWKAWNKYIEEEDFDKQELNEFIFFIRGRNVSLDAINLNDIF